MMSDDFLKSDPATVANISAPDKGLSPPEMHISASLIRPCAC
jgi:hypothetical protein